MVSFTQEQSIICSQTKLNNIAHEQTIICSQLFAGHVFGSRPIKRKKKFQRMIIGVVVAKSTETVGGQLLIKIPQ